MMKRIKRWLVEKYLPVYAREALLEDNAKLHQEVEALTAEVARQQSYIEGMQVAMRGQRRIVIQTGGKT